MTVQDNFQRAAANMARVADSAFPAAVEQAIELIDGAFSAGRKLLVFGNGGSSADAQHLSAELVVRYRDNRQPLPAIALTTNQAVLTAVGNDYSFDELFSRQVLALGAPGDVAFAISTSGASPNVLRGLEAARTRGLVTIGLTGSRGVAMAPLCDLLLAPPVEETARIQEVHLVTYHAICDALERRVLARQREDAAHRA